MTRIDGRAWNQARKIEFVSDYLKYAEGCCLAITGNTKVLCAASFEAEVPPYLVGTGQGWITAEYSEQRASRSEEKTPIYSLLIPRYYC